MKEEREKSKSSKVVERKVSMQGDGRMREDIKKQDTQCFGCSSRMKCEFVRAGEHKA